MPDVELEVPPDVEDIDASAQPFKRLVAVLVVSITFFGAVIGYLQTVASNEEEKAARDGNVAAVTSFATQVEASTEFRTAYDVYTESKLVQQRQLIAHNRGLLVQDPTAALESARWENVRQSFQQLSPLLSEERFSDDADPRFPERFGAKVNESPNRVRLQQAARAELVEDFGGKADAYVAVLTVLAVSLFLIGLSLTVAGRGRRFLFIPGVGLALACVLWAALITAREVSRTPARAINAVAEGDRLAEEKRFDEAIEAYTEAIDARPDYGIAFGHRADAHFLAGSPQSGSNFVSITDEESLKKATADGEKAVEHGADTDLSVVASLGFQYFLAQDYGKAARFTSDALDLNDQRPELWFNRGVIELARGNNDEALEAYAEAVRLTAALPFEFVRTDLFGAARTDLEILARNEENRAKVAQSIQERITHAEADLRVDGGLDDVPRGASVEGIELATQGNFVTASISFDNVPADSNVTAVWYLRGDRNEPFSQPGALNGFEVTTDDDAEHFTSAFRGCGTSGQYRVDVYVEGKRLGTETLTVEEAPFDDMVPDSDDLVAVSLCRPDDWDRQVLDDAGTNIAFASPDGEELLGLASFPLPAELAGGGQNAALEAVISAAVSGAGFRQGRLIDYSFSGFEGRAQVVEQPGTGSLAVAAAVGDDNVVRVLIFGAATIDRLEEIERDIVSTVSFTLLDA